MPAPPELRLHIKRLVLDRAALGADGAFDATALHAELVQRLSHPQTAHAPPRGPLVHELGSAIAAQVMPHVSSQGPRQP